MKVFAAVIAAAALLLGACSSDPEPHPDHELAKDMTVQLYGSSYERADNPESARQAAVDLAVDNCDAMKSAAKADVISTIPGQPVEQLDAFVAAVQAKTGWTEPQAILALMVSAKYRCSEFFDALNAYAKTK